MNDLDLTILVVSYNTRDLLRECLTAVFDKTRELSFEVIVVDNASRDGSVAMIRETFPAATLVALATNVGFGAANNLGAETARGRHLLFLNSDAMLLENTPKALVDYLAAHPEVACVGPRVVTPDGEPQPKAFGYAPTPWRLLMQGLGLGHLGLPRLEGIDGVRRRGPEMTVGWLSAVCLAVRRHDYRAVGGFDPRFFMYAEDVALCGRLRREKGRVVLLDQWDVLHVGGASSPQIGSRIRNAVWQQRHILQVCRDECGLPAAALSRLAVFGGLLLRLAVALLLLPTRGFRNNVVLRTSWARLLDMLGWRAVPQAGAGPA